MKRPRKRLPDTNVIVRYLVRDDVELHRQAQAFFDRVKTGEVRALILESVVAECIYVLTKIYKVPREKAADSLKNLLHYRGIINEDRAMLTMALTVYSERPLDIVDCILYAKAPGMDAGLFSFDEDLNKLAAVSGGEGASQGGGVRP